VSPPLAGVASYIHGGFEDRRKPEAMIDKIAEGSVQKFLNEVTLLGQVFVKAEDGKQTIAQLLKAKEASVVSFTLFVVGEGIAKRANDFAAEVAAQAAAAAAQVTAGLDSRSRDRRSRRRCPPTRRSTNASCSNSPVRRSWVVMPTASTGKRSRALWPRSR
jgi:formate dehydrogenase maturation protein FdhE